MNILLIKRGAIGDVLMTTPLIRQLREIKGSKIDYLTTIGASQVLKNNPYINKLIIVDEVFFSLKGLFKLFKLYFSLRQNYDYVFILDKHFYYSLLSLIFKARLVGFVRDGLSKLFLDCYVYYNNINKYQVCYYLELLEISLLKKVNFKNIELDFFIETKAKQKIEKFLEEKKVNSFVVIVNSGGNNSYESSNIRMLPDLNIVNLINKISENNVIILLGDKNDFINYKRYFVFIKNSSKVINVAGLFNLEEATFLLNFAKKIYTTDCGILHLALSQNLHNKLYVFFGPTYAKHVLPNTKIKFYLDSGSYDVNYILYGKINKKLTNKDFFINFDVNCVN